jgi:multiple sugar transport system substrate-binding protein
MLATLALAGCAGGSGDPEAGPTAPTSTSGGGEPSDQPLAPANIRMWTFLNPTGTSGREVALKQIIDDFQAANPGVTVTVEPQTWDVMTGKFFAAHQAGNAPDVIWVLQDELGAALKLGALEPFENTFLPDWTAEDIADVDDAFWDMGATDAGHHQVSLSRNYFGIIYRKDLFEQKGIEPPTTWDDFVDAAEELTEVDASTGIQRYGFGQALSVDKADSNISAAALLEQQGSLFGDDGSASWANDAGKRAFQLQIDMITEHGVTPTTALTSTPDDVYKDFSAGKYAMINGAGVRVAALQADASFDAENIGFMLVPSFDGDEASPTPVAGWAVGVWSGSEHKEAAGAFVEALISPEADSLWVTKGGQVPVRASTLDAESAFLGEPKNEFLSVMAEGFSTAGWAQPTEFAISGWRGDFNTVVQDVVANGMSLDDALTKAEKAFNDRNLGK